MQYSKPLHIESFEQDRNHPKVALKILLVFIISIITAILSMLVTDITQTLIDSGLSKQQAEQSATIAKYGGAIGAVISVWFTIGLSMLIVFVIAKIFKSDARAKSMFASILRYTIITGIIALIILVIQWIANIDPQQISIDSLNIFDPGNTKLGLIRLTTLISAWLFGVILHSTLHLSKKTSWTFIIIYIILFILIPMLFI
ncbi:YIP1 family protein [Staphylococcus canis]|uniref:Yip1 domain-containing protein n=1 Tax=Staphylococcus canis TaxID=2724942 RepID=A0ABS0T9K5_9STAP|nr:YIP1 family protein [Staphylococcus canis]MBI5974458.1 hypothetical protein [Staphylococcus canis]